MDCEVVMPKSTSGRPRKALGVLRESFNTLKQLQIESNQTSVKQSAHT